MCKTWPKIRK
jgi:hypothetical protein